ncbi:MAG: hypothetical protein V4638_06145 [Bacteroidota bacterium]
MKKNITYLSLVLVGFLLITSCNKNKGNFHLGGTIIDDSFSQNLIGATVKLYQTPVGSSSQLLVASTTTDANGEYHFTFKREKMEKYTLVVSKNNYFEKTTEIPFSDFSLEEEEEIVNVTTTAKSWVRITLSNTDPLPGDVLTYTKQNGKINCDECCPTSAVNYYGALDTVFYCINDGNTNYSFLYSASGIGSGIKSISTTAFDTVDLQLFY